MVKEVFDLIMAECGLSHEDLFVIEHVIVDPNTDLPDPYDFSVIGKSRVDMGRVLGYENDEVAKHHVRRVKAKSESTFGAEEHARFYRS